VRLIQQHLSHSNLQSTMLHVHLTHPVAANALRVINALIPRPLTAPVDVINSVVDSTLASRQLLQ
jgi:hypothetical protein